MKKKIIGIALSSCLLLGAIPAYAADNAVEPNQTVDPNLVISVKEELTIPSNVTVYSAAALDTSSVTYDHNSGISWNLGERQVWGNTQATQGTIKLSSYTRARYEHEWYQGGSIYGDSGRVWSSIPGGRSYAASDWEYFNTFNSGVAKTYYGI